MSNVIYQDGGLKFWNGADWIPFSTNNLPPVEKNQSDLILDGESYYLPLTLAPKQRITSVSVNGIGINYQPNYNTNPARVYGFESNSLSTILITIQ